ncbi:DUF1697 domain-containing protein [Thermoleophilia bacterium SCSIO 60948]|nr:DUF1697 domain-containing protein [Thermoleophilia bacterium SCSIO 60948]
MTTWIALLRGINLGSRNRVTMPELRAGLTQLGFANVRTLVQSGNVVLDSELDGDGVARAVSDLVARDFDVVTPTVVRSAAELDDVIARNPMRSEADAEPKLFQVSFLAEEPPSELVEALLSADIGDERVAVSGREIYSHHPGGMQRSKLGRQTTDKKLSVVVTARNWNSVTKLSALARNDD